MEVPAECSVPSWRPAAQPGSRFWVTAAPPSASPSPWAMKPGAFVLNQQECDQKPTHSLITVPFSGHRLGHHPHSTCSALAPWGLQPSRAQSCFPPCSGSCQLCSQEDLGLLCPSTSSPGSAQSVKAGTSLSIRDSDILLVLCVTCGCTQFWALVNSSASDVISGSLTRDTIYFILSEAHVCMYVYHMRAWCL